MVYAICPTESYNIFATRNRYLQEAGLASGYVEPPSPSSAASVYLPLCTLAANLPRSQTSLVRPAPIRRHQILSAISINVVERTKLQSSIQSYQLAQKRTVNEIKINQQIINKSFSMKHSLFLSFQHSFARLHQITFKFSDFMTWLQVRRISLAHSNMNIPRIRKIQSKNQMKSTNRKGI